MDSHPASLRPLSAQRGGSGGIRPALRRRQHNIDAAPAGNQRSVSRGEKEEEL